MAALELHEKVSGVRGSAIKIPYRSEGFTLTVSVHALRNFESRLTIVASLKEMERVTRRGGRVAIAETLPTAKSKAQEAHLRYFGLKTQVVKSNNLYYSQEELMWMFEEAGMEVARRLVLHFDLSSTPPFFVLDTEKIPPEEREAIVEEYTQACEMIRKYGEKSPPVMLIEALI